MNPLELQKSRMGLLTDYPLRQQCFERGEDMHHVLEQDCLLAFESMAQAWLEETQKMLLKLIPSHIQCLLNEGDLDSYIQEFIKSSQDMGTESVLTLFLRFLGHKIQFESLIVPHLLDFIEYELQIQQSLKIFSQELIQTEHPVLSPEVALFQAGPHFRLVLEELEHHHSLAPFSDSPKEPYLLVRHFTRFQLFKIPKVLFQVLKGCDGKHSWLFWVNRLGETKTLSESEHLELQEWYDHLVEKNLIIQAMSEL